MITLYLEFDDGDTIFTCFNGTQEEALDYYENNSPRVLSIYFPETEKKIKIPQKLLF